MRVIEFFIGNFRSVYRKTIHCDRINVFVGSNNSGKTNILSALRFFFNPYLQTDANDLNSHIQSQTISMKAKIFLSERDELRSLRGYNLFHLVHNNTMIIERKHKADEKCVYYCSGGKNRFQLKADQVNSLAKFFRRYFLLIDIISDENRDFNNLEKSIEHIHLKRTSKYIKDKFQRSLQPAFNDLNKNISYLFDSLKIKFQKHFGLPKKNFSFKVIPDINQILSNIQLEINQNDLDYSLKNKGQGVKNICSFIFDGVFSFNRRLVLLEEPDIHLHPSMARNLIHSIKNASGRKQFFITTHNRNIIDHLGPEHIKRAIMKDGMTDIVSPSLNTKIVNDFFKFVFGRHAECLLAKRVLIVEGETELRALPALSNRIVIKKHNAEMPASLDINEIQIVKVNGEAFHGPIPLLNAFKIDWLILGDGDKWPTAYMATIEKLGMDKLHPRKYNHLKQKQCVNAPLTRDIQRILYKYFKIICLPKKFESLLLTHSNAGAIKNILRSCVPEKYKNVCKNHKSADDITFCQKVMNNDKPEWSIIVGRDISPDLIPKGITDLLKLIVIAPQSGAIADSS